MVSRESEDTQLVHVATDGESYGHHHHHGEMALAWALKWMEEGDAKLTNYGEFLEKFPPAYQARDLRRHLVELLAWRGALALGLRIQQRQRGVISSGAKPLRQALDWLRDVWGRW